MEWPTDWDQGAVGTFLAVAGLLISFFAYAHAGSARKLATRALNSRNMHLFAERHHELEAIDRRLLQSVRSDDRDGAIDALHGWTISASHIVALLTNIPVNSNGGLPGLQQLLKDLHAARRLAQIAETALLQTGESVEESTRQVRAHIRRVSVASVEISELLSLFSSPGGVRARQ